MSLPPYITIGVSIHAPVKERLDIMQNEKTVCVSIHAPVKERLYPSGRCRFFMSVSIHAPVKERPLIRN